MHDQRFERLERLVGSSALQRLKGSAVAVFGIGGVGGYAVEALVRGGVGKLTLVDFDSVDVTNINRQIQALDSTVGQSKVTVMGKRCREINPQVEIVTWEKAYSAETSPELLQGKFGYVLDCIDDISAKLHLLQTCHKLGTPVISAMGAANKLDPTLIKVADISVTQKCRLARTMRKELRRRGITTGIKVVYSTEEFRPLTGDDASARQPTLGSISYLPPLFGLTMAGEVLKTFIGGD